jgi:hypothetical protein
MVLFKAAVGGTRKITDPVVWWYNWSTSIDVTWFEGSVLCRRRCCCQLGTREHRTKSGRRLTRRGGGGNDDHDESP